ncbi:MaoC family dehydratase [Corynebacterium sp. S7]
MSQPVIFSTMNEIESALGTTIGPGEWVTIDQERIDAFADCTEDHQWIHVDQKRAGTGPYGAPIAHGYLTMSLIPKLVGELYRIDVGSARINYGNDRVRFPAPVRAGSRVRARVIPEALDQNGAHTKLCATVTIEAEGEERPALTAEVLTLIVE